MSSFNSREISMQPSMQNLLDRNTRSKNKLSNIYKVGLFLGAGATYIFKINVKQVLC